MSALRRCSTRAALLPADSVPATGRLSGGQLAIPVSGLLRGRGHAGAVVPRRPHGQARRRPRHRH